MADEQDADDKTEEPTQKRLDDALEKGETIYSPEVSTFFALCAATALVGAMAGPIARDFAYVSRVFLERAHVFAVDGASLLGLLGGLGLKLGVALAGAVGAFMIAGIASRYVQDRPSLAPSRLEPKLERLDPIAGFKRVFGPQALGAFAKGALKVLVVGAAVCWALWPNAAALDMLVFTDVAALLAVAQDKMVALMAACLVAFGALAAADYVFTRQSFMKRLRMTREEIKREHRESEGDPQIKARLRQIRYERARRRMMAAVPTATVVVTNPTHFAVALRYDAVKTPTPVCVAKGVDDIALRIRALAEAHEVPVIEDPPLARALYATAELEAPIPRQHFEAVARVIGVVLALAQRRRRPPS